MNVHIYVPQWRAGNVKLKLRLQFEIDLGLISLKEMVETVGGKMNTKGKHKEKMAKDRTLEGRWSTFG